MVWSFCEAVEELVVLEVVVDVDGDMGDVGRFEI